MRVIGSFMDENENNIYKNAIYKLKPELVGCEIKIHFLQDIECSQCGKEGGSALDFRLVDKHSWERAITFSCSDCRDRELLTFSMEKDLKEQRLLISERLMNDYFLLPEKLKGVGFKDYYEINSVTTVAKQKTISYVKTFLASDQDCYNLLIQGNPGTGKTHLCVAIARTLKEKGYTVGFLTTGQFLSIIRSTFKPTALKTDEDVFQDFKKLDLLILDDLGSEAIRGNENWIMSMIFELVETRSGKPTIYTSNLTDQDLPMAVGARVFSRLYDNTKIIDLFTEDYRKRLRIM